MVKFTFIYLDRMRNIYIIMRFEIFKSQIENWLDTLKTSTAKPYIWTLQVL